VRLLRSMPVFHNGGNDGHVVISLSVSLRAVLTRASDRHVPRARVMASGDPVDIQRDQAAGRNPRATEHARRRPRRRGGVRVRFSKREVAAGERWGDLDEGDGPYSTVTGRCARTGPAGAGEDVKVDIRRRGREGITNKVGTAGSGRDGVPGRHGDAKMMHVRYGFGYYFPGLLTKCINIFTHDRVEKKKKKNDCHDINPR